MCPKRTSRCWRWPIRSASRARAPRRAGWSAWCWTWMPRNGPEPAGAVTIGGSMTPPTPPAPPLPRRGQQRAFWRAPASPSALAWMLVGAASAHGRPLLLVAPDNQHAHQLEGDLHTLLGDRPDLPVLPFPDWETLPYDQFSPHPAIVSQRLS